MPNASIHDPAAEARVFQSTRFFASLDGLRCLSILAVILHHTTQPPRTDWLPILHRGFLGVDIFFVISGFLIVTLLLRERDRSPAGAVSLRQFYLRRFLRIFPIYYGLLAALVFAFIFVMPRSDSAGPFFSELPYYLTYTSNWIPAGVLAITWSLAAEEQFYLFWPPVEKWLRGIRLIAVLLAFIAINQLVNFGLLDDALGSALGFTRDDRAMLQATFTPICLGVLLAHVLHSPRGFARLAPILGRRWSAPLMLLGLLLVANLPGDRGEIAGLPRLLIQIFAMLLIASCVMREDHALKPLLTFAPIARIGVISYGMYLLHMFALHAAGIALEKTELNSPGLLFALTLALTVPVSELSFRFYETPFLRLKERFKAAPSAASTAAAAPAAEPAC